jgi:hypothetical protein
MAWAVIGFEQPFKLEKRLVVKGNSLQFAQIGYGGLIKHIPDRIDRKGLIMLFSREPFLVSRSQKFSIHQQSSGAIMIECRNAQDILRHDSVL